MKTVLLILAAGSSTRMGRTKALLKIGGRTFIQKILETGACAGLLDIVVTVSSSDSELLPLLAEKARLLINTRPELGPVGGIKDAVSKMLVPDTNDYFSMLMWPVDCPVVSEAVIKRMLEHASHDNVVVPIYHGKSGHPVLFGGAFVGEFKSDEVHSARDIIALADKKGSLYRLVVDDPAVLDDIDSPTDYNRLLVRFQADGR
ncbi:MAG: NTP transferase domain-containing protein [Deltaproteobacteria bacterium]|nr:NTP transferase domain-containing protein [Deltaproteobacteria bacterium]